MTAALARLPPGVVLNDVLIPDTVNGGFHPHKVDFFIPNGAIYGVTRALCCFHGGNGTKETFGRNLAITSKLVNGKADANFTNWQMLGTFEVMVAIPQGQACVGITNPWCPLLPNGSPRNTITSQNPEGIATWSNNIMWSSANDMAFAQDLKKYIQSVFSIPGVSGMGHSNGGMLMQRLWREQQTTFSNYISISGPCSIVTPTIGTMRPMFCQMGLLDGVINTSDGPQGTGPSVVGNYSAGVNAITVTDVSLINSITDPNGKWVSFTLDNGTVYLTNVTSVVGQVLHFTPAIPAGRSVKDQSHVYICRMFSPLCYQGPATISVADVAYPAQTTYTGPWQNFSEQVGYIGLTAHISDGVTTNVKIGTQTTWSYLDVSSELRLELLSNAGHPIVNQVINGLPEVGHEECTGRRCFNDCMNFIRSAGPY